MDTYHLFAEASGDEHGDIQGGDSGNQSGVECRCRRFYVHKQGWKYVYRNKSKYIAAVIADEHQKMAINGFVGYDSNERRSYMKEWIRSGRDGNRVHTDCETDCSASTYVALMTALGFKAYHNNEEVTYSNGDVRLRMYAEPIPSNGYVRTTSEYCPKVHQVVQYMNDYNTQVAEDKQFEIIYSLQYAAENNRTLQTNSNGSYKTDSDGLYYDSSNRRYMDLDNTDISDTQLRRGDVVVSWNNYDGRDSGHIGVYI